MATQVCEAHESQRWAQGVRRDLAMRDKTEGRNWAIVGVLCSHCALGVRVPTLHKFKIEKNMKYENPIGTMNCAMSGATICVAAIRELWAKPANGDASFAVHSIVDKTQPDWPCYVVYVTDYRGKRYDFWTLAKESQCELCDFVIGVLYE